MAFTANLTIILMLRNKLIMMESSVTISSPHENKVMNTPVISSSVTPGTAPNRDGEFCHDSNILK